MTSLDAYATFLTAHWDEIERYRDDLHDVSACRRTWDGWGYEGDCDCDHAAYVLADLAAKRAIVDECSNWDKELDTVGELAEAIIVNLAAPFRDHPDHPANQEGK